MKPPAFTYHRPVTVEDALRLLAEAGDDGKVLAGGQSLVPLLNMRLAAPAQLVDINRLDSLAYVHAGPEEVRVGALTRHADLGSDAAAYQALPLLRRATACVAHQAIRNRGTTVGSLAHADPAAEMPAVLTLLDGFLRLASAEPAGAAGPGVDGAGGTRTVTAGEFFVGPLTSAIHPGELVVEAVFPTPPPGSGTAWLEISRRQGDYALCGLGMLVTLDDDLRVTRARAAGISVGPTPVPVDLTEAVIGQPHDSVDWTAAAGLAKATIDPDDDIHATADYRRHLIGVLTMRAGRMAAVDAYERMRPADGAGRHPDHDPEHGVHHGEAPV